MIAIPATVTTKASMPESHERAGQARLAEGAQRVRRRLGLRGRRLPADALRAAMGSRLALDFWGSLERGW